ncbi:efflux RND transporter permease subunit [Flexibacterium corallicola]|uniref:efflux RND transporter permease subunit n=1 Tax=Flexibacterium corallicola TaxID=3037259 RepID=UPI0038621785
MYLSGGTNSILTLISLFVLTGLASKNVVLIVELARDLENKWHSITEAAIEASRLCLRSYRDDVLCFHHRCHSASDL